MPSHLLHIGILALQGAYQAHLSSVAQMGHVPIPVREPAALASCDGLILPGGESTAMLRLITSSNLTASLAAFVRSKPVFATCAGIILLATTVDNRPNPSPIATLDSHISRNGFGSQTASFIGTTTLIPPHLPLSAPFIRAPRITSTGNSVQVLGRLSSTNEPTLITEKQILAASFHPELTQNLHLHQAFAELIKQNPSWQQALS